MRSYESIGHTADVRLKVEGGTLEELFQAAILGMSDILYTEFCAGDNDNENCVHREIAIASLDATALLIDFLSEVLTASYEEKAVFCETEFLEISDLAIKAKVCGRKVSAFKEDIKAVTYHEARVKRNAKRNWETMIIFDI